MSGQYSIFITSCCLQLRSHGWPLACVNKKRLLIMPVRVKIGPAISEIGRYKYTDSMAPRAFLFNI